MSLALSTARASVRQLIRDVDVSAPAVKGYILDQAISNHYQMTHARLGVPMEWQTLTALAANDADYTLSGGSAKEFHSIGLFRLASTYQPVEKVSPAYMGRLRSQTLRDGQPMSRGRPIAVAITEELPATVGTTETAIQVYPTPTESDTLEGLFAVVASTLSASADLIQLGQNGQRAVEYYAAAELLAGMTGDTAKRLDVDKDGLAKNHLRMAEKFIEWEQVRVSRQRTGRFANTSYTRP